MRRRASAETPLGAALKHVEELARYDPQFPEPAQQLAAAKAAVEDVSATVRDFAEKVQASPERLEEIEDRLAALDRLKRKYGAEQTLAEVIAFGAEAARKLAEVENRDALLAELQGAAGAGGGGVSRRRQGADAARTEAAGGWRSWRRRRSMSWRCRCGFEVQVTPEEERARWTAQGWDGIECLIATNAGEPLKPLRRLLRAVRCRA